MNTDELVRLVAIDESDRLEFKKTTSQLIAAGCFVRGNSESRPHLGEPSF